MTRACACCAAEGSTTAGSVWLTWSTGAASFVQNLQAPAYPTNTLYAPQTPDPASVASVVSALPRPAGHPHATFSHATFSPPGHMNIRKVRQQAPMDLRSVWHR